jgi:hypothetical protein
MESQDEMEFIIPLFLARSSTNETGRILIKGIGCGKC